MTGKLVVVVFSHLFTKTYVAVLHISVRKKEATLRHRQGRGDSSGKYYIPGLINSTAGQTGVSGGNNLSSQPWLANTADTQHTCVELSRLSILSLHTWPVASRSVNYSLINQSNFLLCCRKHLFAGELVLASWVK